MFIVILRLEALPEKRLDLKQNLKAFNKFTSKFKGCLNHTVYQDIECNTNFSMVQRWQNRGDLDNYLRSDKFTVFMEPKSLLNRPPEISVNEVARSSGWDAVEAVRAQEV